MQDGDTAIGAAFYPERDDRASDSELAAAALDDLLGTDLVAPTVMRTIDGQEGALQLRYPGAVSEQERVERRLPFSGWCPLEPQLELVRAFDVLTLNRGRTAATVLFHNDLTDLTLVGHAPGIRLGHRLARRACVICRCRRALREALRGARRAATRRCARRVARCEADRSACWHAATSSSAALEGPARTERRHASGTSAGFSPARTRSTCCGKRRRGTPTDRRARSRTASSGLCSTTSSAPKPMFM